MCNQCSDYSSNLFIHVKVSTIFPQSFTYDKLNFLSHTFKINSLARVLFILDIPDISFFSVSDSRSVMSNSLRPHGLEPTRVLFPWDSLGKNTGVGSHSLLLGIFLTQGSNLGLLHCRQTLYSLSQREKDHTKKYKGSQNTQAGCMLGRRGELGFW